MDREAVAELYDATSGTAWRLARCLSPDDETAAEVLRRVYLAIAAEGVRVPGGHGRLVHVLTRVRREVAGPVVPPLHPAA
jgi:hypothetical protein